MEQQLSVLPAEPTMLSMPETDKVALAAKFGDAVRYDSWIRTFLERKSAGRTPQEVARYLHTLSSFRVPGLAERTLRLMDEGTIPQEALSPVLGQLLAARQGDAAQHYGSYTS